MATLAVSGLPLLQHDNQGAVVATQSLSRELDSGLFFTSMEELGTLVRDEAHLTRLREQVWRQREQFMFDSHADRLVAFFRAVIDSCGD